MNNDLCINVDGVEYCKTNHHEEAHSPGMPPYVPPNTAPTYDTGNNNNFPTEGFSLNGINMDNILKAIFFGAIFYLLSLPDVYKITKKCCKSVDGVLLHSIVFAVVYFIVIHFI